jgi:hypothetical protein
MMGSALDVVDPILAQLRLETGRPAPTGVLAALIREHFFGHAVLRDRRAVHLQHVLRRLAAKHVQPYHVAGVIIEKADEVGVLASQVEGEDVGLPHLVGGGSLKEARLGGVRRGWSLGFFSSRCSCNVRRTVSRLTGRNNTRRRNWLIFWMPKSG